MSMLKPGLGHTHKAYIWSYGSTQFDASPLVVYDFTESRGGHHARAFLGGWSGKLVCDDFSGYKALLAAASPKLDAPRTRAASSKSSKTPSAASWQAKRCSCMAYGTMWRPVRASSNLMRPAGNAGDNNTPVRWQITCASG